MYFNFYISMDRFHQYISFHNKKNDPANYRPISLTSHFCKLLERLLLSSLLDQMNSLDIVQGGFHSQCGILNQSCGINFTNS